MEPKQNENNLFSDFLKVFTGLIIGLASFQILAPLIWNYLSELLHLEKYTSYCVILCFYFILPGVLLLIWWFNNKHKLLGLLSIHPNRGDEADYTVVVKVLTIFLPVYFIFNALLFLFCFWFDNAWLFYSLQAVASLVSLFVLLKIIYSVLQNLKLEHVKQKRKHYALVGFVGCLFFLFLVFEITYLSYTDKTKLNDTTTFEKYKINNRAEILNAFRLNDFKEELIAVRKKFEFNLDRIHEMQDVNSFDSTAYLTPPDSLLSNILKLTEDTIKSRSILDTKNKTQTETQAKVNFTTTNQSLLSLAYLIDRVSDSIVKQNGAIVLSRPPYKLEKLLGYQKIRTTQKEDSTSLAHTATNYENIITTLSILENNLTKLCKRQLNIVLNNNQMKGIFLFAFMLVVMLCFYLLLKTNEDIFAQLQSKDENKTNELINSKSLLNKGALSDVWIIVNILVWLLIPLLKPVTEDSIKIDKPFQSLTFSKYITPTRSAEKTTPVMINSQNPLTIHSYASGEIKTQPVVIVDTVWLRNEIKEINNKIEKLKLNSGTTTIDTTNNNTELKALLEAIQKRVYNMNTSAQEANVLRKLHRRIKETFKPEDIDNNTFKPDANVR